MELELLECFGRLVNFVKKTEERGPDAPFDEAEAKGVVADFSANWRAGMSVIHGAVTSSFSSYLNGKDILMAAFTQLVFYYQRFLDILESRRVRPAKLVELSVVLAEKERWARQ